MRTLKDNEFKTFEQLVKLKQESLLRVLINFLKKNYKSVIYTDKYVVAEGEAPVALVAHLDTVFTFTPVDVYFDQRKNVIWSPEGLGADDRAGVFAIVQIIQAGYRPHIIFTTDEEVGGLGATALAQLDCPFSSLNYIIELDRRGSNDCVFYDCDNQDFVNYIESFGFEWNYGSYSDISELCPAWGIAGVNLSIGYRDEHSISEVLFVGQMLSTIEKVKKMIKTSNDIAEPYKYIPSKYAYAFGYGKDWYLDYGYNIYSHDINKCSHCKKYHMAEELIPVVKQDCKMAYYCPNCIVGNNIAWCTECGSAYEKISLEAPTNGLCPYCLKEKGTNKNENSNAG